MDIYVFLCSDRINLYACDLIQRQKHIDLNIFSRYVRIWDHPTGQNLGRSYVTKKKGSSD